MDRDQSAPFAESAFALPVLAAAAFRVVTGANLNCNGGEFMA